MNKAQYRSSFDRTKSLLRRMGLSKIELDFHRRFTAEFFDIHNSIDYVTTYEKAIQEYYYDILLFDESILQYSYDQDAHNNPVIRYAYYEFPFALPSYDQYLIENGFSYDEAGELFRKEYEQEFSESILKEYLVPIRYDYSEDQYTCGVHPASHLHIGYLNSIRIPISMILTPYMFTFFILKQCYYKEWERCITEPRFLRAMDLSKTSCMALSNEVFGGLDKKELYLV